MYPTVCPLHGPSHDITVGDWMYLTVPSVARVTIAQWENECISLSVLSMARGQFSPVAEHFEGFSLADHTLPTRPESVWQKMAQSLLNLRTLRRKANVQPWTENG